MSNKKYSLKNVQKLSRTKKILMKIKNTVGKIFLPEVICCLVLFFDRTELISIVSYDNKSITVSFHGNLFDLKTLIKHGLQFFVYFKTAMNNVDFFKNVPLEILEKATSDIFQGYKVVFEGDENDDIVKIYIKNNR